jgi:rfaE bifunctional protein kinase chain/domain
MTSQDINELFEQFNSKKVLIIGDVMIDAYLWGKVDRISPEAPVPVVAIKKKDFRLGGAANVAMNVANLGATPMLASVIGDGNNAQLFARLLNESGISDEWLVQSGHRPTTIKTRVISGHQQMMRIDEEVTNELNDDEQDKLTHVIMKAVHQCDIMVFEDYDKGVLNKKLITEFIEMGRKLGKTILVDPKKKNFLHYKGATVFKPNLKELKEGLNLELPSEFSIDAISKAAKKLRDVLEAETAMITLSEHGVFIGSEQEEHHIPAHMRDIYDVSGAGDTVIAISSILLACGVPLKYVAEIANLGGGLVCEKVGVVPIDKESLKAEALKIIN